MSIEEKNITVKHFVNKRAGVKEYGNDKFYPLYIQVSDGKNDTEIESVFNEYIKIYKSDINRLTNNDVELTDIVLNGFISEPLLDDILENNNFPVSFLLNDELEFIKSIIEILQEKKNGAFSLDKLNDYYKIYLTEISQLLDSKIKNLYQTELKDIFLNTIDEEEKKEIFDICNFLIHFINWDNNFSNFYDSAYDLIPTELKKIENLISKELRITIKAYMSFHAKINVLQRFFEKREIGKISTLSYLDWENSLKGYLKDEFEKIFGEQKAIEYIVSLQDVIESELE